MLLPDTLENIRKHASNTVKVYTWTPVATQSFFYYLAEDNMDAVQAEAQRQGISFDEAAAQVSGGRVVP